MIWDDNLNPEGAAEQFDKTLDCGLEIFGTAGQFVYGDSADNAVGADTFADIFMFGEQVGIKYKLDDNTAFKIAVSAWNYSGSKNGAAGTVTSLYGTNPLNETNNGSTSSLNNDPQYFDGPFVGAASAPETNVTGINNLGIIEVPAEFDFKAWGVPMRIFSDFAYNYEADGRANAARNAINAATASGVSNSGVTVTGTYATDVAAPNFQGVLNSGTGFLDQAAYQIGYEAGVLKKKGDWQTRLYWQSTGYYAVDPNLIDSDIFNAATNMEGVVVSASYNWTDGLTSTLRYAHGNPVNDKMASPNVNQDLQTSNMNTYDLFQADLMWKF
jgi:hypothetical protein